jgi:hypothetical protein
VFEASTPDMAVIAKKASANFFGLIMIKPWILV